MIGFLSPIYNHIYKATHSFYIGFVYLVSVSVLTVMICLLLYCIWFWKKLDKLRQCTVIEETDEDKVEEAEVEEEEEEKFDAF